MAKEEMAQAIQALGLSMATAFVPYPQARNAILNAPAHKMTLNWSITSKLADGRELLTTDYTAGCAHCPSYVSAIHGRLSVDQANAIARECLTGRSEKAGERGKPIVPELADVLYSLAADSDAIDHPTFESWASDLGYDTDSRKAEAIYRACLETALKLRAGLGEDGLKLLREAARDY